MARIEQDVSDGRERRNIRLGLRAAALVTIVLVLARGAQETIETPGQTLYTPVDTARVTQRFVGNAADTTVRIADTAVEIGDKVLDKGGDTVDLWGRNW